MTHRPDPGAELPAETSTASELSDANVPAETSGASDAPEARVAPAGAENDPLRYTIRAVVLRDGTDRLAITRASPELVAQIEERFAYYRAHLTPRELANWLPRRVAALDGLTPRSMGGCYFIPRAGCAAWGRIVQTLAAVSAHRVFAIPVMKAEDTAAAFLDALQREAEAFAMAAYAELPTLGKRGREHRTAELQALVGKMGRYEALFGEGRLAAVRAVLATLEVACAVATVLPATDVP